MDYHSVGYRECAAEVARYLVTCEGMDIQDPLRLRLMSHLQCFSSQREIQMKQTSGWNPLSSTYSSSQYNNMGSTVMPSMMQQQSDLSSLSSYNHSAVASLSCPSAQASNSMPSHPLRLGPSTSSMIPSASATSATPSSSLTQPSTSQFTSTSLNASWPTASSPNNFNPNGKPYRPWGAELAY